MTTTYTLEDADELTDTITVVTLPMNPGAVVLRQIGGTHEDVRYDVVELTDNQLEQLIKLRAVLFPKP